MTYNDLQLNIDSKVRSSRISGKIKAALPLLSLLIILAVFWWLKLTGITMAGEAFCGFEEHAHTESCFTQTLMCGEEHEHTDECYTEALNCTVQEHIHTSSCYSDINADLETQRDWEATLPSLSTKSPLSDRLVTIASSQIGYKESEANFTVDSEGTRHGYTRYGEWYGNSYGDWSAMFVSFCLNYADTDKAVPYYHAGADTMASAFKINGRFAAASQYVPRPSDIVFFNNNTAAIIKSVNGNTASIIQGDYENAVTERNIVLTDETIYGYGRINDIDLSTIIEDALENVQSDLTPDISMGKPETVPEENEGSVQEKPTEDENDNTSEIPPDANSGAPPDANSGAEPDKLLQSVSPNTDETLTNENLGNSSGTLNEEDVTITTEDFSYDAQNTPSGTNMKDYLNSKNGDFFFTLTDNENKELPKDADRNYIVSPDTTYKMSMTVKSPSGFAPGTYYYQLPAGLTVNGGNGSFILADGTNVGTWSVGDDGLITFNFNQNVNNRTNVVVSATMGSTFSETLDYIDFDGKITVVIEKPPEETKRIEISKWGHQGNPDNGEDPTKIYWTIQLYCPPGVAPSGSILRDHPNVDGVTYLHSYDQSDIDNGIYVGMSVCDPVSGQELAWHDWTEYVSEGLLSWTSQGWVYHIPDTGPCRYCHNADLTSNDKATYFFINYTSTPNEDGVSGSTTYSNVAQIAGQQTTGWVNFQHKATTAGVIKTGDFIANDTGGRFTWRIEATIPAIVPGQKADYFWYLWDETRIVDANNNFIGYINNDSNLSKVQMERNGIIIDVPRDVDATDDDEVCWGNTWSADNNGVYYARQIDLFCRCRCTEETCPEWYSTGCGTRHWDNTDFCRCWTITDDVKFILTYDTDKSTLIEQFGGMNYYIKNDVQLNTQRKNAEGNWTYSNQDNSSDSIYIPGYFSKELTKDFDGYVANYTITVNESMLPLSNGTPITIHDMMTDTLAYISGSLVITWNDADGNTGTLEEDVDYTVTYDGSGSQVDKNGNKIHILDIILLNPQSVKYTLNYDATLILPEDITSGIKYKNSASVEIWGQELTVDTEEKVYADINIAAHMYHLSIYKTDSQTSRPLKGAVFGMYNDHGGHITTGATDEFGRLPFETDIVNGIVLREHVLYYVQELEAPEGYRLDDKKYWFCFCDSEATTCAECDAVIGDKTAVRIPFEQIGTVEIENTILTYELPATGGIGAHNYYILWGVVLITTPVVYRYVWRRKRERRLE